MILETRAIVCAASSIYFSTWHRLGLEGVIGQGVSVWELLLVQPVSAGAASQLVVTCHQASLGQLLGV